ncbi:type I restriction endonuclease subunit R [Foetidibacter luteolus]|uniref:type I restriction endonuclease subunit R n=1 Tax=Foetidibacter luteolus TaxID=2608880 RepID=UPI00129B86FD|nr:type I restriction endonuclease subunit R [Foetidibacter luteolus]
MKNLITEDEIEQIALDILINELGYEKLFGPDIIDAAVPERTYAEVVLPHRLQQAIDRINPHIPAEAREEAFKKVLRVTGTDAISNNEAFHVMLTDGIDVKFRLPSPLERGGGVRSDKVWLIDYTPGSNKNEFLVVNQFTVIENHNNKRPDIVLFINGLPLVVIELKNATDEQADIYAAYQQLQTYKRTIPSLFHYNCFMIASDGWFAKAGTISSGYSRFMEWKSADGEHIVDTSLQEELEPMVKGMLAKQNLLDIIRHFIVFEKGRDKTIKKIAAYHQYYAVNKAIATTVKASGANGDKRAGVIWHTQGSGKSLSMVFYTGKMVVEPAMNNPTIVVLTDRNDLDDQLFGTFSDCQQLLRQEPRQATDRKMLRELLSVASGGIVFTTIQKFLPDEKGDTFPMLTSRRNIVVVADEAHRSQYDFIDGFARHMRDALPNASFIGFTGTPIEKQDASTQAVFGDYIDVYDIEQAVKDGATVRIFYESRLAKVKLSEADQAIMDQQVEEITEDDELTDRQKRFAKWASKEAVVGSDSRLKQIAKDMVAHFEERTRGSKGKAMFVAMSRRIAVELHDAIVALKPEWYHKDDDKGGIKVIMTGSSSDGPEWAEHIRNKKRRTDIGNRLKDPDDELKIVIVRDMWLTGFDAPVLHTLYIDKPMSGHNLMQAIARINRVFGDKQGGLVVDYIGIAQDLKKALAIYTESKGKGKLTHNIDEAADKMMELFEVVAGMFVNFNYKAYYGKTAREKMQFVLEAANYILGLTETDGEGNTIINGKQRFKDHVTRLSQAFALSVTHPDSKLVRDDLAFFQAIKARIAKFDENKRKRSNQEIETALRQIVNDAVLSEDVIDIFDAAGIKKPDISILDDKFLAEVKNLPQKNLALELLKRLLEDEVAGKARTNIAQSKKFSVMLTEAVKRYQAGLLEAAQIIDELIQMAQEMREAADRGKKLNLREDELAFYDALAENPTAEAILGDVTLKAIAHELVENVRKNTSIDWQLKESVQAKMRTLIKRILRKYKYPPDDPATGEYTVSVSRVLSQAELLADGWSGENGL